MKYNELSETLRYSGMSKLEEAQSILTSNERTREQLVKYLDHLAGCMRGELIKSSAGVSMRITPPDAECVQKAADALRVTDEPSASKLVVELRERGEWAAEEKRYALRRRAADEIDRLRAALERYGRHEHPNCHDLTLKEDGSFGPRNGCLCGLDAVLSGRSAPETRKQPETPVAWFRWGGSAIKPVIAWGNWPPPEPDDVAWYPLYSTPEGRPAQETSANP